MDRERMSFQDGGIAFEDLPAEVGLSIVFDAKAEDRERVGRGMEGDKA